MKKLPLADEFNNFANQALADEDEQDFKNWLERCGVKDDGSKN